LAGAGIDLRTNTPAADDVRGAVHAVLFNGTYRRAAAAIQTDFAGHDGPAEAAALIERVASTHTLVARAPTGASRRA
jgi:UDP:flavonoid glycosyltransferase YjiC (YdhE family)